MKDFKDKVVVISGGGSGIGRSLALQFNLAGAKLALIDRDEVGLRNTRALLEGDDNVSLHQVDVTDQPAVLAAAEEILALFGRVDVVINSAGITLTPRSFNEINDEEFRKVLDVNMWGTYNCTRAFLPLLEQQTEASLVNISSLAGLIGLYGYSPYAMSKFAVRALSESLQSEYAGSNLHIMVVHPGGVKTNLLKNAPDLAEDERENAHQTFQKISMMPVEKAAALIIKGIRKKKHRLVFGFDSRLVLIVKALFPRGYLKFVKIMFSYVKYN